MLQLSSLLPDRKPTALFQQPLINLPESKDGNSLLLFWHWEECLKRSYKCYIFAREEASKDVLATLKDKSLKTIYALLKSKSEQEHRLLSALVNKLRDPENKAASNADYLLSKLLSDHPNMKAVVTDEVDNFLFRPHLVMLIFEPSSAESPWWWAKSGKTLLISKLVEIISTKRTQEKLKKTSKDKDAKTDADSHVEMDSRLLSALLTGFSLCLKQ